MGYLNFNDMKIIGNIEHLYFGSRSQQLHTMTFTGYLTLKLKFFIICICEIVFRSGKKRDAYYIVK